MNESRSPELDAKIDTATQLSFLKDFPAEGKARLLKTGRLVTIDAGSTLFLGAMMPQPALMVEGIIRVYMTSSEGKEATTHYIKPGGATGILAMVTGGPPPIRLQALVNSTLLVMDDHLMQELASNYAAASWAIAQEMARIFHELAAEMATTVFGTVRQRLGNHLLNLASMGVDGRLVIPPLSNQELANAVGTAREVVSRSMGELTRLGLIEVTKRGIVVLDPERLLKEVRASVFT